MTELRAVNFHDFVSTETSLRVRFVCLLEGVAVGWGVASSAAGGAEAGVVQKNSISCKEM